MREKDEIFDVPARDTGNIQANVISHALGDMSPAQIFVSAQSELTTLDAVRGIAGDIWDALAPGFNKGSEELVKSMYTGVGFDFHGSTYPEMSQGQEQQQEMSRELEGRER